MLQPLADQTLRTRHGQTEWHAHLDGHADQHGFHVRMDDGCGALFTEDDERLLLVSLESSASIQSRHNRLPFGLEPAGCEGWSQLCLYAGSDRAFAGDALSAFVADLAADRFFDHFDDVLFYGAGAAGVAATALSAAVPGCTVLAVGPLSVGTDACVAAPSADAVLVVYDPWEPAEHRRTLRLDEDNTLSLHTPMLGTAVAEHLASMGILVQLVRLAGNRRLGAARFASLWRDRRRHAPYLHAVLDRLEDQDRPFLAARWCRAILQKSERAPFRAALARAERRLSSPLFA